jgi:hypothetical protein
MNKEEMDNYLVSIGGLTRSWKSQEGDIIDANFFGVDEGWYDLIKNLIDELIALGWDKQVAQVKEKFGMLRFYLDTYPEGSAEVITKYEKLSGTICERCGNEGSVRKVGWWLTLCDTCDIKNKEEKEARGW